MPPKVRSAADPAEWIRRALSNLARARDDSGIPEVIYEDLCFDAQQAAEKALKAVLVARKISFPKVHSIGHLINILTKNRIKVPLSVKRAAILTEYAVAARYPGITEDVGEPDYKKALKLAQTTVEWAIGMLD